MLLCCYVVRGSLEIPQGRWVRNLLVYGNPRRTSEDISGTTPGFKDSILNLERGIAPPGILKNLEKYDWGIRERKEKRKIVSSHGDCKTVAIRTSFFPPCTGHRRARRGNVDSV